MRTKEERGSHNIPARAVEWFAKSAERGNPYAQYILYGLYHGILLAVVEVYQKKSKFYKKYRNNKCYVVCSWFINLNIVMLGFLIFSGYLTEVWNLILTRF